jgi:hypothetical protein
MRAVLAALLACSASYVGARSLAACSSFDDATADANDAMPGTDATPDATDVDAGGPVPDGGADADAGPPRGCPTPLPANTQCWDFDEGSAPSGPSKEGSFALDESTSWSAQRSLRLTTSGNQAATPAWAYLQQPIAGVPTSLVIDQRVRIGTVPSTEMGQIRVTSSDRVYAATLVIIGSSLSLVDGIYVPANGTPISPLVSRSLGTLQPDEWHHVVVTFDFMGVPGASSQRRLRGSVDGIESVDETAPAGLETFTPTQTLVWAGITLTSAMQETPRSMNLDDVLVTWTK